MNDSPREHVGGIDGKRIGELQAIKVLRELSGDFCFQEELTEGSADVEVFLLRILRQDGVELGYNGLIEG